MSEQEEREAAVEKLRAMGIQFHNGIPILPFKPDAITESRFCVIVAGDLACDEDVQTLITDLWCNQETEFYYFHADGCGDIDAGLARARTRGDVLMDKRERNYFRLPDAHRNFIHVEPRDGEQHVRAWERELVEKGPEFWRVSLKLSQRKRDELDTWRKVQLEEYYRTEARNCKYAYTVFLSYSSGDAAAAREVHDKITGAGHPVFMAEKAIQPGDDFAEEIRLALVGSREVWVLVSPSSAASEWVMTEWGAAWALGKKIIPILHRCAPEDLPGRLARLQCADLYEIDRVVGLLGDCPRAGGFK